LNGFEGGFNALLPVHLDLALGCCHMILREVPFDFARYTFADPRAAPILESPPRGGYGDKRTSE